MTCNTRAIWYTEAAMGVAKLPGLLIMFFLFGIGVSSQDKACFFFPRKFRWV